MLSLESRAKVKPETHTGELSPVLMTCGSADPSFWAFWALWESESGSTLANSFYSLNLQSSSGK